MDYCWYNWPGCSWVVYSSWDINIQPRLEYKHQSQVVITKIRFLSSRIAETPTSTLQPTESPNSSQYRDIKKRKERLQQIRIEHRFRQQQPTQQLQPQPQPQIIAGSASAVAGFRSVTRMPVHNFLLSLVAFMLSPRNLLFFPYL
jgi:hypothetical protein